MEDKRLRRVFDRVKLSREREDAMLANLLREKKEVSNMKNTRKRRLPAAALAAAVLIVVLAGTAIAAEYLGRIDIELLDGFAGEQGEWYSASMAGERVPADSLSEDIWTASASADARGEAHFAFDSRLEAEAFVGLDLADNLRLEQMPTRSVTRHYDDQPPFQSPCVVGVGYTSERIPAVVSVQTCYEEPECFVSEFVQFGTDIASEEFAPGVHAPMQSESDFQVYVTSSGMEVSIYSDNTYANYSAYFAKDNVFYSIDVSTDNWDTLIEILDAYE